MRLLRINNKNRNSLEGICKFVNLVTTPLTLCCRSWWPPTRFCEVGLKYWWSCATLNITTRIQSNGNFSQFKSIIQFFKNQNLPSPLPSPFYHHIFSPSSSSFYSILHLTSSLFTLFLPSSIPFFQNLWKLPPVSTLSIHYFFPFPSIYLPFPHLPSTSHSRIRERIFTKHMENGQKLCTGPLWEEMSIKDWLLKITR